MSDAGDLLQQAADEAMAAGSADVGLGFDVQSADLGHHCGLDVLARRIPKAELHLHLCGALRPSTVARLRSESGEIVVGSPIASADYGGWDGFVSGLLRNLSLVRDAETAREVALEVLADAVDVGCRHLELMVTVSAWIDSGWDAMDLLTVLDSAFRSAREWWDLSGGVIVEADRGAPVERAIEMAELAGEASAAGLAVLGFGNDGDPLTTPFAALAPAYERARSHGLRLCGHVDLPDDVAPALDLGLDRIDHGYAALFAPELLAQIVERRIPLTLCATSNLVQMPGIFPDWEQHPLAAMIAAGAVVTLHTDDPPFFFTDLAQEYRGAARLLGWDRAAMADMALASLEAAWMKDSDRAGRLASLRAEVDALVANPRVVARS